MILSVAKRNQLLFETIAKIMDNLSINENNYRNTLWHIPSKKQTF